jgi:hypothetical protein
MMIVLRRTGDVSKIGTTEKERRGKESVMMMKEGRKEGRRERAKR